MKPHFKVIANRAVQIEKREPMARESPVEAARRRFGQRFAHEQGATWKPRTTPLLIEWLQKRGKTT